MEGPKGENRSGDVIGGAIKVAKIATGEIKEELKEPTQRHKGGKARAAKLTDAQKSKIAKKAAKARWKKK